MREFLKLKLLAFLIVVIGFAGCTAELNMTPYLFVSDTTLNFGDVVIGSTKTLDLEIQNHDSQTLIVGDFQLVSYSSNAQGDEFEIEEMLDDQSQQINDTSSIKIDKFSKIIVRISFTSAILDVVGAKLRFTHNDGKLVSPMTINLIGTGIESYVSFIPAKLDFGEVTANIGKTEEIILRNTSTDVIVVKPQTFDPPLTVSAYKILSIFDGIKTYTDVEVREFTLQPNEYIVIEIQLNTDTPDTYTTSLVVPYEVSGVMHNAKAEITGVVIANDAPEIVKIDTTPVRIGEIATIVITVFDPNESQDSMTLTTSIDLTPVKFIDMVFDPGAGSDKNSVYTGTVLIPNNPSYYGYRTITAQVMDLSGASDSDYAFQMIYTGSLIEVGASKPFTTIKPAVLAAVDGDCVLVHDGVYSSNSNTTEENRDISFEGKEIIVTSLNGVDGTTIQIDGAAGVFHRAFVSLNGETLDTIIHGFTIKGGFMRHEYGGGAIVCVNSSNTILNCLFRENVGTCDSNGFAYGGVISAINADMDVRKTHFINNSSFV